MKKILFNLIVMNLVILNLAKAQTVIFSDDFGNRINERLTDKTSHFWVQDSQWVADNSTTIFIDQEGSTTLTEAAANWPLWSLSDPVYSGGNTLNFAGSGQALTAAAAPTDNLYGFMAVFRPTSIVNAAATAQQLLHLEGGFYGVEFGAASAGVTNEIVLLTTDGTSSRNYWASATDSISAQVWHILIMQWDGAKYQIWLNGAEKTTATTGTPAILAMDTNFRIGIKADNTRPLIGNVALIKLYDQQLTDKDVKEETFLPGAWHSKTGGLTGVIGKYNLGIVADTVSHAITTTGAAVGHIDAWGASGGEILSAYNKAGYFQTFELTTDSTRYTISSITFAANDSLFIGSAGTVTVDNIYLETAPDVSPNIYSNNFTGFPEFPDFINDEAIQ